ncbi:NAD-dependent succinate-semialdehyde dehydrogenase [Lacisediminihabitans changchengi]|uniref:NAD-dependent succinate-semialdehyde dehydrogenase n=1 Tax=Lacisediminihabitans changchengi TaxID=2787634 RepID=A0A934SPF8_9MICO|nr:NAD-dependent succinate-semialdehyde dehydrogenase [Lacisediminihabitans changchengi]MBK4349044.1 NAD-dependent succinate-semialdehyde dehydrogenase [Lacisediminihabitans changchengi]
MTYQTINPYTNKVVATFPDATKQEVDAAITAAHDAFLTWRETPFSTRTAVLAKAAELLRADKRHYAELLTLEMGKVISEAEAEVELSADILQYYADHGGSLLETEQVPVALAAEGTVEIVMEPLGVLLTVEPWNFPYYQVVRVAGPQLLAGNTILLKHASNVPQAAAAFDDLFARAGLPAGAFKNLYLPHALTEYVIDDPRVRGVALTGSEEAGAIIAAYAAKAVKKSTLELGGSDAFVVLADADMDKTVEWAVFGRHWNAGQVCVSAKRLIVVDEIFDEFMDKYRTGVAALVMGDPMVSTTTLAPLSSQGAADKLAVQVEEAVAGGATAETLGKKAPSTGAFFQPTILTGMNPKNPSYYEEFFGPVSIVLRAKDEADAIAIANDSPFGLGGSVFTKDTVKGEKVARQIDTGMVYVNHPTMVKADIPFGGIKHSGYGHELTNLGIQEFINKKVIDVVDIGAAF